MKYEIFSIYKTASGDATYWHMSPVAYRWGDSNVILSNTVAMLEVYVTVSLL